MGPGTNVVKRKIPSDEDPQRSGADQVFLQNCLRNVNFATVIVRLRIKTYFNIFFILQAQNNTRMRFRSKSTSPARPQQSAPKYVTSCYGREVALFIDKWSRLFFPFAYLILNIVYWTTYIEDVNINIQHYIVQFDLNFKINCVDYNYLTFVYCTVAFSIFFFCAVF